MRRHPLGMIIFLGLGLIISASVRPRQNPGDQASRTNALTSSSSQDLAKLEALLNFGKIPLFFIPNKGQLDSAVSYYVQGKDQTLYFTADGIIFALTKQAEENEDSKKIGPKRPSRRIGKPRLKEKRSDLERWAVRLDFIGASGKIKPEAKDETGATVSYFKGKPAEWKTGLPTYSRLVYNNLWPGIDLVYSGTWDRLKYEFIIHPGVDPSLIRLAYYGASGLSIDEAGRLDVKTPAGHLQDDVPVAYQQAGGERKAVAASYKILESAVSGAQEFCFTVGRYDTSKPLTLDPALLIYCGYFGGTNDDIANAIAVDSNGDAYIAGTTTSPEGSFPETVGPGLTFQGTSDAFVAKVNSSGTALVYCGYIGGADEDAAYGIAVDNNGNAYVAGYTLSNEATFPVKVGPDLTFNGVDDAFVAKVNASGSALVYCGYIGGADSDEAYGIAVDNGGNAYVVGYAMSNEATFPVKVGPDPTQNGISDAFVAKVNSSGSGLVYCGYIGGSDSDIAYAIATDSNGNAYVAGSTASTEATFPITAGPDLSYNDTSWLDAFVAKVNPSGDTLVYCGYIGGDDIDEAFGIFVDSGGKAYVTGYTYSAESTFPVTAGPDTTYNGGGDAFVAEVNSSGKSLVYCGYIGGANEDAGYSIAVDGSGNAYVTGYTMSNEASFPVKVGPDLTQNGLDDAFVTKVNSTGTALVFSGYIGGSGSDRGYGIAVDSGGIAYVAGGTNSSQATFPVAVGPDLVQNGSADAFAAKVAAFSKDDLLVTWASQGVYYRNSDSGAQVKLASPATQITAGDMDADGIDDLIGNWPAQGGVWVKYSTTDAWSKLVSTADWIASGDMNGDGRCDLIGTWAGQGVFYRNSAGGLWVKMATPAAQITSGDLDNDGIDDLIGNWPSQGGVWVKYSQTLGWSRLASTADWIASGDMNGDGRCELLGTWSGQGVFYRNSATGEWVKMATPAAQIVAGYVDNDIAEDLLGMWPSQGGVWVKYSKTGAWAMLTTTADWIAAGKMRVFGAAGSINQPLGVAAKGNDFGPTYTGQFGDLSEQGPRGILFNPAEEKNTIVGMIIDKQRQKELKPGPGDPGFIWTEEKNLVPREERKPEGARPRRSSTSRTFRH